MPHLTSKPLRLLGRSSWTVQTMTSDPSQEGRWPANVLLESTTIIDQQSGITTNTSNYSYKRTGGKFIGGIPSQESKAHWRTETGGASRFFKVVKE